MVVKLAVVCGSATWSKTGMGMKKSSVYDCTVEDVE